MKLIKILGKAAGALLLFVLLLVLVTGISPVYRFRAPRPFSGPDIFNPYASLDTAAGWKRALFHTHTRVNGPWPMNECPYDAAYTDSVLRSLGYDIVTFSNHNEITPQPFQVPQTGVREPEGAALGPAAPLYGLPVAV